MRNSYVRRSVVMVLLMVVLAWSYRADAANLTYGFGGTVTKIDNLNSTVLDGSLAIDTPYLVVYTFDDSVPPSTSSPTSAGYNYNVSAETSGRTFSMTLTVGNYSFTSSPGSFGNFGSIAVYDNASFPYNDAYSVVGEGFNSSNSVILDEIGGALFGPNGTHAGTDVGLLPDNVTAYTLTTGMLAMTSDFDVSNPINGFAIWGSLDEFMVVPEPATFVILAPGLVLLIRRRRLERA